MNSNCFSFVCHVRHENSSQAPCEFLNLLHVPAGYSVDKKVLQGNFSMAQGYNFAMRNSTAKYKIYLSEYLEIVNRNFLKDILSLFENHPELGMLGVLGAKKLPLNGNWRESTERYGKLLLAGKSVNYLEVRGVDYEPVQVIDGMIMVTQYDLTWREDLFKDHFFYDSAQCLEFYKAGYAVGIPKQHEAWCFYHNNTDTLVEFYQERELFCREYQAFINQ